MPDEKEFVHLHVHTEFSLLDGLSQIKRLVKRSADAGMKALAITDHGTMFGVIDFYRACKASGIKPIIGMEAYLARRGLRDRDPEFDSRPYHLLLLAKNQTGYKNLLKLASVAQLEGYYYRPRIDRALLEEYSEGLIATSGCLAAEIPRMVDDGREDEALKMIGWYRDVFGPENFYLELQHHNIDELHALNKWLLAHQDYANVPLVATNDVHYVLDDDYDAHDTLLCIQTGNVKAEQNRLRFTSRSFHLRTPDEMWSLFAHVPEALTNTLKIAEMCHVSLDSEGYHLPVFPVPEGFNAETYLRHLCEQGLRWRYGARADDPEVADRLKYELQVIHNMGFDTYFLIVWDLCEFARHADIWWNVRGSGAGSVAAYSLGITNIDPLLNNLLFERFLNPGRVSMPDIDLDYPEDRRAEMIQYCAQKYGEDKVAAIITFGTMGAKAAIRDVGRAFDMPLPEVDRIARLIPTLPGKPIKFEDALGDDPEKALPELKEIYANDEHARRLIDTARQLEGITRHASTHAAGVIVADKPLVEYIPLHRPTKGSAEDAPVKMVTQFDMDTCESIGLLKVDFLGLSTLTIMRRACELIEQYHGLSYDLSNIPYRPDPDDPDITRRIEETFTMIGRGETVGVFQLESQGMRRMLTDMRPTKFEHIVAGLALYRPGPLEYIPLYNRRLHEDERVEYKHPKLEPILNETYGIIIYQEDIMRIGAELFGYSLGEADLMRRAVSKKKKEDLLTHRQIFIERGPEHGVDPVTAGAIFDDIEFFARYGFNKCLTRDTEIIDAETGRLVRIGDLADGTATIEHTVTCDTDTLSLQSAPVTNVISSGVKPVYRLTTWLGHEITATANHPFYTTEGWQTLGELKPRMQIATPRRIPVEGKKEWAEERLLALAESLSPDDPDAVLPDEVFELTNRQITQLLVHLWEKQGWCNSENYWDLHVCNSKSTRLIRQLSHLCRRLGILTGCGKIGYLEGTENDRDSVFRDTLYVTSLAASHRFAKLVTPYTNVDRPRIPLSQLLAEAVEPYPRILKSTGWSGTEELKNLLERDADSDIYWDVIMSIEYAGEEEVFDLTVPDTHNFVANDIIVHNSHAADYAVLTCQTAYLKCHYPHEYMAALMSVHRDEPGKVGLFAADCARMGIDVLPPTVNDSELDFSIQEHGQGRAIRFGLGAIKNLGIGPAEHILEQRAMGGRFRDLEDFCRRVDARSVNKRALESLIKVGALDEFAHRPALLAALDRIISFSADFHKAKDSGQMSLFGEATGVDFGAADDILGSMRDVEPVTRREMLNWEKELVGLYVTDHPLKPVMEQLQTVTTHTSAELNEAGEALNGQPVIIAGLVMNIRSFATKKGDMMAILTIEDITGTVTAVLFPRTWGEYRDIIDEDAVIIVNGKADTSRGDLQVIADSVRQDFEMFASADHLPALERQFSWLANEADEPDSPYDEETGEMIAAPETSAPPPASEPVMPASAGASANTAPPIEPPSGPPPELPPEPPAARGMLTDQEMPGWLQAETDNGWTPAPDWEYNDETGYRVRQSAPDEEPSAFDDSGRIKPPPAPAARARTSEDTDAPRAITRPRRGRPTPPPAPAPEPPGRMLTLTIERSDDAAKDRRRMTRLHGFVTQYPGHDHFRFVLVGPDDKTACLNFPNHPIRINEDMLAFARNMLGEENVVVEEP